LASGFLEAMMGARRPGARADEHAVLEVAPPAPPRIRLAMTARLFHRMLRLESDTARFQRRLATVLARHRVVAARGQAGGPRAPSAAAARGASPAPAAALAEFDALCREALRDWQTPIVNDLFLMFAHGALRRTASAWLGSDSPALVNGLLAGGGISARPGQELVGIGAAIRARADWSAVVRRTPPEELLERLAGDPALAPLKARIDAYLETWADRAPRELQLERRTFREDPTALLAALRTLAIEPGAGGSERATADIATTARREVARRLRGQALAGRPAGAVRLAVFTVLLRLTRRGIRRREEMRLLRGQVFGVGRRIFRDLGASLTASGMLAEAGDVHYLELSELREIALGAWSVGEARSVVGARRARYAAYAAGPRLPNRLETRGPAADPLQIVPPATAPPDVPAGGAARTWRGIGAAVGRARGECLVVLEPTVAPPTAGRIIAARSTDPGWVPILVGAAGLAVEQGSLLSHSAIVARELGIPTVVGLPGLLDDVRDGDVLEVDGSSGEVRLQQRVTAA
ncbi:MAG TPA: PEP-utilizing enzyme, partial [Candidatus Limnocylindrales bacterium]|nr:PEP-utilizing enzyme [Candidatus Limnocylindrales bacterium]